ncbi:MAG: hypothetical protein WCT31_01705 [Candidatus Micrarchaeia archaeon]
MAREQRLLNAYEQGRTALHAHRRNPQSLFGAESVHQSRIGASRDAINDGRHAIFALYMDGRIGRLFRVASNQQNDSGLRDYARRALEQIVSKTEGVTMESCRVQFESATAALARLGGADVLRFPAPQLVRPSTLELDHLGMGGASSPVRVAGAQS